MRDDDADFGRYPLGTHLLTYWRPSSGVQDDSPRESISISIPDVEEPVVIVWTRYSHPRVEDVQPEYLGRFSHAGVPLRVTEYYEHITVTPSQSYRRRFKNWQGDCACCTEVVERSRLGAPLEVEPIEHGAYRGLWRSDVFHEYASRADLCSESACRILFNLRRGKVTLFRWRYHEDGSERGSDG